ncbi:Cytochrome P450 monooxygenase eqxH [Colletotrichum viniferum]|nr:Cytochrome P450 monooxygenase eqxH [Colletotrichum viniferum]
MNSRPTWWEELRVDIPFADQPAVYILTLAVLVFFARAFGDQKSNLPELNPKKAFELTNRRRVSEFFPRSAALLAEGRSRFGNKLYKAYCDWGEVIVLSPQHIEELRSDARLSFLVPANDDTHGYIPGFDAFSLDDKLAKIVTKYLTKALAKLTAPISQEATFAMRAVLTDSPEWHVMSPKEDLVRVVSQMSTRIFMGEELCRNEEWTKASGDYTITAFKATDEVRAWPRLLRPIVHWAMPVCQDLRQQLVKANNALEPHIKKRNAIKAAALAKGQPSPFDDLVEWWETEYGPSDEHARHQLTLTVVAIHTTSDLLQQTMIDIAMNPEILAPLREEVITVLGSQGLKKTALYNLKLMDSVIKESQRMKPALLGLWSRQALADVELLDGFVIKKGQRVLGEGTHMWNSEYWKDAAKFDGYRFLRLREAAEGERDEDSKTAHLVSTSSRHLGFGHGIHACPGRFFAANEIKIALCHILLKYDWKLPDGFQPKATTFGMSIIPDPATKFLIRRRKEELDLDSLEC